MDLDSLVRKVEARRFGGGAHALFAADQDRRAEPLIDERTGGVDDLLFLALDEDNAFWRASHALDDPLHGAGDWVAPRRQLRLVGHEIDYRPPRNARGHCCLRYRDRHDVNESGIERHRYRRP